MNDMGPITAAEINVYTALAAAQAVMETVIKGAVNSHFRNRYADLADVVAAVRPALAAHGLAFFHVPVETPAGGHAVKTVLAHGASNTTIEATVPLVGAFNNMQGYKSATTYAKRIGLESVTGVAPEDDDDGNEQAAQARSERRQERPREEPRRQEYAREPMPEARDEGPVDDPDEVIVADFVTLINATKTLDDLTRVWTSRARNFEARDPRAIAAKDARKAALNPPSDAPDRWPGDAAQRPLVDETLPY